MVGRAGDGCSSLLLAGDTSARLWFRSHIGSAFATRWLWLSVSSAASCRLVTACDDVADFDLGFGHAASKHFAESCAELAELRRAGATHHPASRWHLGCLGHEGLPLVFGIHGRVGAVVWAGVRVRSWYVSHRRLVMRFRTVWLTRRCSEPGITLWFAIHASRGPGR